MAPIANSILRARYSTVVRSLFSSVLIVRIKKSLSVESLDVHHFLAGIDIQILVEHEMDVVR